MVARGTLTPGLQGFNSLIPSQRIETGQVQSPDWVGEGSEVGCESVKSSAFENSESHMKQQVSVVMKHEPHPVFNSHTYRFSVAVCTFGSEPRGLRSARRAGASSKAIRTEIVDKSLLYPSRKQDQKCPSFKDQPAVQYYAFGRKRHATGVCGKR